jgi:transducin (beta)-like 1
MAISSEEINFLIQRYFYECGFDHSLYTFNAESLTDFSAINGAQIPPGALITLLQKGLLYIQLEKEINSANKGVSGFTGSQLTLLDAALREGSVPPPKPEKPAQTASNAPPVQLDLSNAILLAEHSSDVLCCAWSSDGRYLASGSGDNTAIIWHMSNSSSITPVILQHGTSGPIAQHQVSCLDWANESNILVTGCSDGSCHVWDSSGAQLLAITDSNAAVHVVRWDPSGLRFLSGDAESHLVVRTEGGDVVRSERLGHGAILDASWRSETAFAVCCDDGTVVVVDADVNDGAVSDWAGHTGAINGVAWSPSGEYLASAGDDKTVRLWHKGQSVPLKGHTNSVYAVRWNIHEVLASASLDNTVRIWDARQATCVQVLASHGMPIYALSFTPDGTTLVSGSVDQTIKFWRVSDGQLLVTCIGSQNIFDVQVDKEGTSVAACFVGGNVFVIPLSQILMHSE